MPFTVEQFLAVFARYNEAIWPLQVVALGAGIALVVLVLRRGGASHRAVLPVLAAMWLVNGIGYHGLYFARINPLAIAFAAVFVVQAVLLAGAAVRNPGLRFGARRDRVAVAGLVLAVFAVAFYPLLGVLAGQRWPAVPAFGVAPCPTTIYTIGLLLMAPWERVKWLMVVPGLWAGIGGSAAILLRVPQDVALLASLAVLIAVAAGAARAGRRPAR
jgi:hypothetical protein